MSKVHYRFINVVQLRVCVGGGGENDCHEMCMVESVTEVNAL